MKNNYSTFEFIERWVEIFTQITTQICTLIDSVTNLLIIVHLLILVIKG